MKSKSIIGAVVASALFMSTAFAADTAAPLPAGKPAGAKDAAFIGPMAPLVFGGLIAAFVIVAATGGFNSSKSASGTTGTSS